MSLSKTMGKHQYMQRRMSAASNLSRSKGKIRPGSAKGSRAGSEKGSAGKGSVHGSTTNVLLQLTFSLKILTFGLI